MELPVSTKLRGSLSLSLSTPFVTSFGRNADTFGAEGRACAVGIEAREGAFSDIDRVLIGDNGTLPPIFFSLFFRLMPCSQMTDHVARLRSAKSRITLVVRFCVCCVKSLLVGERKRCRP